MLLCVLPAQQLRAQPLQAPCLGLSQSWASWVTSVYFSFCTWKTRIMPHRPVERSKRVQVQCLDQSLVYS